MRKFFTTFLFSLFCYFIQAQAFNWAKQLGGDSSTTLPRGVLADADGNVYTAGYFTKSVDFDPGTKVYKLISAGNADIFITKFNAAGNLVWAKRIGGKGTDAVSSMALDPSGNIYTTGSFTDEVDFDPGADTQTFKASGYYDMFICKIDPSGNLVWVKQISSNKNIAGTCIALDDKQNIYTTGYFHGKTDFDPGAAAAIQTGNGAAVVFVLKLNSSGDYVWAKQFASSNIGLSNSIAVDAEHSVYTTGKFSDNIDFDPGPSTVIFSTGGNWNIFISKLDSSGNYAWAKHIKSDDDESSNSIALDSAANVYTTGNFWGTVDFDPGSNTADLVSEGSLDIFISKLDKAGNFVWAKRIGGSRNDNANFISLDASGNVYTTGTFEDSADFDPGSLRRSLRAGGDDRDAFVSKLDASGNFVSAKQFKGAPAIGSSNGYGTCLSKDMQGNLYVAGYFEGSADFDPTLQVYKFYTKEGTDCFVVKLGQCNASGFTITTSACNKYVLNGKTYTSNGIYTQLLENKMGCDSAIIINLKIKKSSAGTLTDSACRNYKLNGQTYTSSGVYTQTLVNKASCDSIITLNLIIKSVDKTVTQTGATLTSNAAGAAYKWLDCNSNKSPLPGKTTQSFTASKDGSYAVEVTQNTCKDTSACYSVTLNSVDNTVISNGIAIYPNPTLGDFSIKMSTPLKNGTLKLISLSGQTIIEKTGIEGSSLSLHLNDQPAGIYFIEINQNGNVFRAKIVKE